MTFAMGTGWAGLRQRAATVMPPYRIALAVIVMIGVAERIAWNVIRPTAGATGEAANVAQALAAGRGFADAYEVGQGPTAHLLPTSPGIAGAVYTLLGIGSPAAEFVLAVWSIALALGTYLLLYRAFGRLGTPRSLRIAALAIASIAPTYIGQEAVDFRIWEGGLTGLLMALTLDCVVAADRKAGAGAVRAAVVAGLLFFVNPPAGLGAIACVAVLTIRRRPPARWWAPVAAGAVIIMVLAGPWAARNHAVLGEFVPLRSNAGLELSVANYPGALHAPDRAAAFMARLEAIHPAMNADAYREVQDKGEVAYARRLGDEARRWMAAHPDEAVALMLLHIRQTLLPEPWQFTVFGTPAAATLRATLAQLAGLFGVIGIGAALLQRRRGWLYPLLIVGTLVIASAPFQPVKRYTYLVYPTLLFCAVDLAGLTVRMRRRSQACAVREA